MSFNLSKSLSKTAAKTNLDHLTERQLANNGKGPNETAEAQLEKTRSGEPKDLAEKQLDAARINKDAPSKLTESQLSGKDKAPNSTSEAQLDADRTTHSEAPVEKRLDGVRESGFNLKTYLAKRAGKSKKDVSTTEGQLGNKEDGPKDVTEKQLEDGRQDGKVATTEKLLEKARTGEAKILTEGQLDGSTSKLVQHRNAETSAGNINKVEEQRIAAKKANEKEKYEAASETDPKLMLPEVEGKDGLKTAAVKSEAKKVLAGDKAAGIKLMAMLRENPSSVQYLSGFERDALADMNAKTAGTKEVGNASAPFDGSSLVKEAQGEPTHDQVVQRMVREIKNIPGKIELEYMLKKVPFSVDDFKQFHSAMMMASTGIDSMRSRMQPDGKLRSTGQGAPVAAEAKNGVTKKAVAVPGPMQFGHGLNAEAMNLLKQYDIEPEQLFRYDDPQSKFQDIYAGIQAAKSGDVGALKKALEVRFGKRSWIQKRLSDLPAGSVTKVAGRPGLGEYSLGNFDVNVDDPFHMDDSVGYRRREVTPRDIDDIVNQQTGKSKRELEEAALAEGASRGVAVPSDAEVSAVAGDVEEDEESGAPAPFEIDEIDDVAVGVSTMRQITMDFDQSEFENVGEIKTEAAKFLISKFPSLIAFKMGQNPLDVARSVVVMMKDNKAVATLPIAAFEKKETPATPAAPAAVEIPEGQVA